MSCHSQNSEESLSEESKTRVDSHNPPPDETKVGEAAAPEFLPPTSSDGPSKAPLPNVGSAHATAATLTSGQQVPSLPEKSKPPPDATKDGKERHSRRRSSRKRSSSTRNVDATTLSTSHRAPSLYDIEYSVTDHHDTLGLPLPPADSKKRLSASSTHASAPARKLSSKRKSSKGAGPEGNDVSQRSPSDHSVPARPHEKYERIAEQPANEHVTKVGGEVDHTPQMSFQDRDAAGSTVTKELPASRDAEQQATEGTFQLQTSTSDGITKRVAAGANGANLPNSASARDEARSVETNKPPKVRAHVTHPTVQPRITTTGMLCSAFFVICVIAASVILVLVTNYETIEEVACIESPCVAARRDLYALLNTSADPCVDFYDHVCGKWVNRETGGSFYGDSVKTSEVKLQEAIASDRLENYEREGAKVLSQIYKACERYVAVETTLTQALESADAFLSLSTLKRADSKAEVAGFLIRTCLETGLYSVVAMMIVRDGGEEPLYVAPGSSLNKRFLRNGDSMGATTSESHPWRLLRQVLEAFPDVKNATDVAQVLYWLDADLDMALETYRKPFLERAPFDVAFHGFVDGVTVPEWLKAANLILPAWRALGRRGTVLMMNAKVVRHVLSVLFSKGTRIAALYLSAYLASYVATMENDKRRVVSGEKSVAWLCLSRARECLTKTWPQLLATLLRARSSASILEDIFTTIKKASTSRKVFTWLGEKSREVASQEVASTSMVIQEPIDPKANYSGLDVGEGAHNGSLFTDSDDHAHSFVSKYWLARRHDQRARMVSPPTMRHQQSMRSAFTGDVVYLRRVGVVLVPGVYHTEPYMYGSDVPCYFNYGTVGALLASQVAIVVHPDFAGFRHGMPWWARDTHDRYSLRIRCLVDLHYRLGFKDQVAESPQIDTQTRNAGAAGDHVHHRPGPPACLRRHGGRLSEPRPKLRRLQRSLAGGDAHLLHALLPALVQRIPAAPSAHAARDVPAASSQHARVQRRLRVLRQRPPRQGTLPDVESAV
ncbi:endothelin-converting enzyme 1-like isoform X2 [Dermacentor albipictus]|uniref:endothelin-converting enzyme 1-like isoform X2 n=1 Tax=Dermacentor albipictus TaxID=60249 RepID=UPI0038FCF72B